ncbi:MAG: threonine synthase, partial [Anaerolineales bacterium]|nr:threonine synthase [Anaerolineales bacterium]
AAAFAGLQQAVQQNRVAPEDRVVVINTGNGLKDVQSAMRGAALAGAEPHPVRPLLADVRRLFG